MKEAEDRAETPPRPKKEDAVYAGVEQIGGSGPACGWGMRATTPVALHHPQTCSYLPIG